MKTLKSFVRLNNNFANIFRPYAIGLMLFCIILRLFNLSSLISTKTVFVLSFFAGPIIIGLVIKKIILNKSVAIQGIASGIGGVNLLFVADLMVQIPSGTQLALCSVIAAICLMLDFVFQVFNIDSISD